MNRSEALAPLQAASGGKGQHYSDDEQKERIYQILEMEALPLYVLKLALNSLGHGVCRQASQPPDNLAAANDPEHVESAKRIDRDYAMPS
jgi:hypothetical protein